HHRDQAFTAFETKTLGTRVLGAQVFLQAFSCSQTLEQVALNVSREGRTTTYAFQTLGKPVALLGINDVVEFGTNGAAIRLLQGLVNFPQSCLFLANEQFTGTECGIQVSIRQRVTADR